MTDLERAQWAICGEPETWIPMIVMHLAASRREGAEAERERVTSDATRENLVRVIRRYFGAYDQANGVPEEVANRVLECFAALPLTPEKPT